MKKYILHNKIVLSILLISFLGLFIQNFNIKSLGNLDEIKFVITSESNSYFIGEQILIKAKIINESGSNIYFKDHFMIGSGLDFIINDFKGKNLENVLIEVFHEIDKYRIISR